MEFAGFNPSTPVSIGSGFDNQISYAALHTDQNLSKAMDDRSPFPDEVIGFHSNHGAKPGSDDRTYQIKINQDRAAVTFLPFEADSSTAESTSSHQLILQVYDGHGPGACGSRSAHVRAVLRASDTLSHAHVLASRRRREGFRFRLA